jgi:hypothetical protein
MHHACCIACPGLPRGLLGSGDGIVMAGLAERA